MFNIGPLKVTVELVISLCAIGLTMYQAYLTRQHNRLSVRPHLVWHINRERGKASLKMIFTLKNEGIGPALIREMYFELDGKRFEADHIEAIESFAKTLLGKQFVYHIAENGLPGIGASMPPSSQVVIAKVAIDCPSTEAYEQVEAIFERASFKVRYESLYEETFWLNC